MRKPSACEARVEISGHEVVRAVRRLINNNENFNHEYWAIADAETFERAARYIREGYAEAKVKGKG
jgi:hypothetical protein